MIEVLIVVAIISLLASVILLGLGPARTAGRDARRLSDLNEVRNALELYFNRCGYYPGAPQPSFPCGAFTPIAVYDDGSCSAGTLCGSLTGSNISISQVPDDPTAGQHSFHLFPQYRARCRQWMSLWREELDVDALSVLSEMIL